MNKNAAAMQRSDAVALAKLIHDVTRGDCSDAFDIVAQAYLLSTQQAAAAGTEPDWRWNFRVGVAPYFSRATLHVHFENDRAWDEASHATREAMVRCLKKAAAEVSPRGPGRISVSYAV